MGEIDEKVFFLILALLSTSSAYIPVDIKKTKERVNSIIRQVRPDLIVTKKIYGLFLG